MVFPDALNLVSCFMSFEFPAFCIALWECYLDKRQCKRPKTGFVGSILGLLLLPTAKQENQVKGIWTVLLWWSSGKVQTQLSVLDTFFSLFCVSFLLAFSFLCLLKKYFSFTGNFCHCHYSLIFIECLFWLYHWHL